uniref:Uncharacterized protein n=1 Tax=Ectopseudomonas oleovorans TaxID=301 RepID=A0A653B2F7_ECTOL
MKVCSVDPAGAVWHVARPLLASRRRRFLEPTGRTGQRFRQKHDVRMTGRRGQWVLALRESGGSANHVSTASALVMYKSLGRRCPAKPDFSCIGHAPSICQSIAQISSGMAQPLS